MEQSSDFIPIRNINLHESEEYDRIKDFFMYKYNCQPDFFVKVPGRVNLIGEHVDYSGYPVLPIALSRGIIMAVKTLDNPELKLANINPQYGYWEGNITSQIRCVPGCSPEWFNYALCGIKGAVEDIGNSKNDINGFIAVVGGNIPPAAGLSSSSALVCAASLSMSFANKFLKTKKQMAELCAKSEHLIGTQGGGMDQAIAFLAETGSAQYIFNWKPVMSEPIYLPSKLVFVVAHSLVEANKAATDQYNNRVRECKFAAQLLAKEAGLSASDKMTLKECQDLIGDSLHGMIERTKKLPDDHDVAKNRALHVFTEAQRVERFLYFCKIYNLGYLIEDIYSYLGDLMKESHESLRTLYECSHPGLDRLVALSESYGVHARLTGAGWGGCIVCLCPEHKADDYVNMLKNDYYAHIEIPNGVDINNLVFKTMPGTGAEVIVSKNS